VPQNGRQYMIHRESPHFGGCQQLEEMDTAPEGGGLRDDTWVG